jgi:hypothetical protein
MLKKKKKKNTTQDKSEANKGYDESIPNLRDLYILYIKPKHDKNYENGIQWMGNIHSQPWS